MIIFSILAFLTLFLSICIQDRKKSLKTQSINCLFEALYALTINAYTGAILGFINYVRSSLFVKKDIFSKKMYLIILLVFESVIIINCGLTWSGAISLLPTLGSVIRTFCLWQTKMKYIRFSGILSGLLFGTYYIYYKSWFMFAGYLLLFVISLYNFCKIDLKLSIYQNRVEGNN